MFKNIKNNFSLDSYLFPNTALSIKKIYDILNFNTITNFPKKYNINEETFIINGKDSDFIYIEFEGNYFSFLLTPIKIKYFINDNYLEYDLFSENQFNNLAKELKIEKPKIIYNNIYKANYFFPTYLDIYKTTKNIYIKGELEINILSKYEFISLQTKEKSKFLGKYFNSAEEFDKNYYLYFPKAPINKEKFYVLYSEGRNKLCDNFKRQCSGPLRKYFGKNSIGKSLTLIGTLKYSYDHKIFKTLYINCKIIEYYSRNNQRICKQILIDEIKYLFFGDYDTYYLASNYIINYELLPNDLNKNYWSLINGLFQFFNESKFYIISFDQYNSKFDPFDQIKEIWKTKSEKDDINITIMILSALNEQDVLQYKVKSLLNEESIFNYDEINTWYIEIKDFINPQQLKLNDEDLDDKLEYLGRNILNFNQITSLSQNNNNIEYYIEKRKKNIKGKLYKFFGIKENISSTSSINIYNFLSFSVEQNYSFDEFRKIYNNIPFKYFNMYKGIYNKEEHIELNYRFPIINDIFDEIYSDIVFKTNINNILFNKILECGSKGDLFEKIVIKNFTPGEYNNYCFNYFDEFIVSKVYTVDKFVPKKNEGKVFKGNQIINIENKPFLLKQEIFGGKAFDIVIVEFFGHNAIFFCFQITGHKKKSDLMGLNDLKKI